MSLVNELAKQLCDNKFLSNVDQYQSEAREWLQCLEWDEYFKFSARVEKLLRSDNETSQIIGSLAFTCFLERLQAIADREKDLL